MQHRYKALDGLRGVAALMVVAFHIRWTNHFIEWDGVRNGFLAVDLFFMLSGFVLANTRLASVGDYKEFLIRRLFRLYPLHLATLAVLVFIELVKAAVSLKGPTLDNVPFSGPYDVSSLVANVLLLQAIAVDRLTWNVPSWSISSEFIAYVLFGLAVLTGLTRRRWFDVLAIPTAVVLYGAVAYAAGTLNVSFGIGILRCLAGFWIGVYLFRFSQHAEWLRRLSTLHLSAIQLGLTAWVIVSLTFAHGPYALAILPPFALSLMFLQQDRGTVADLLQLKAVSFLGLISYSIYMIHFPILLMVERGFHRVLPTSAFVSDFIYVRLNLWLGDALFIAIMATVVGLSWITFKWIEEPWRRRGRVPRVDMKVAAGPVEGASAQL
jgi:peptidoglycan/LPS O-acetylase OafA/YrhL